MNARFTQARAPIGTRALARAEPPAPPPRAIAPPRTSPSAARPVGCRPLLSTALPPARPQDGCIICPSTKSTFDIKTGEIREWYPDNPVLRAITPRDTCRPMEARRAPHTHTHPISPPRHRMAAWAEPPAAPRAHPARPAGVPGEG